jgi:hypothetical protein
MGGKPVTMEGPPVLEKRDASAVTLYLGPRHSAHESGESASTSLEVHTSSLPVRTNRSITKLPELETLKPILQQMAKGVNTKGSI